jgi:hypothetical protein
MKTVKDFIWDEGCLDAEDFLFRLNGPSYIIRELSMTYRVSSKSLASHDAVERAQKMRISFYFRHIC